MYNIITDSGKKFNLLNPDPSSVDINDIVTALCNLSRWTGHFKYPYTVCLHTLFVYYIAPISLKKEALCHDMSEAYIGDISRPLKKLLYPSIDQIENKISNAIYSALNLNDLKLNEIKYYDNLALEIEGQTFNGWESEYNFDENEINNGKKIFHEIILNHNFHYYQKAIFISKLHHHGINLK